MQIDFFISTSSKNGLLPFLMRVLRDCPETVTLTTGLMLMPGNWRASMTRTRTYEHVEAPSWEFQNKALFCNKAQNVVYIKSWSTSSLQSSLFGPVHSMWTSQCSLVQCVWYNPRSLVGVFLSLLSSLCNNSPRQLMWSTSMSVARSVQSNPSGQVPVVQSLWPSLVHYLWSSLSTCRSCGLLGRAFCCPPPPLLLFFSPLWAL